MDSGASMHANDQNQWVFFFRFFIAVFKICDAVNHWSLRKILYYSLSYVLLKIVTKCLVIQADTAHYPKPITARSSEPILSLT